MDIVFFTNLFLSINSSFPNNSILHLYGRWIRNTKCAQLTPGNPSQKRFIGQKATGYTLGCRRFQRERILLFFYVCCEKRYHNDNDNNNGNVNDNKESFARLMAQVFFSLNWRSNIKRRSRLGNSFAFLMKRLSMKQFMENFVLACPCRLQKKQKKITTWLGSWDSDRPTYNSNFFTGAHARCGIIYTCHLEKRNGEFKYILSYQLRGQLVFFSNRISHSYYIILYCVVTTLWG